MAPMLAQEPSRCHCKAMYSSSIGAMATSSRVLKGSGVAGAADHCQVMCSFEVQDATMDFGPVPYDDVSQLNIILRSTGLVPFSFYAELDAPEDPAFCSLYPRQGDLAHGGSTIMSLKVRLVPARSICARQTHMNFAECAPKLELCSGKG